MFTARRLVDGLFAGRHLSPMAGAGIDFHDYRAYTPGDDPAEIDWKLFGRTDRYYIRRYRHHTDLNVYLMLDVSASMDFAAIGPSGRPDKKAPSKLRYASTLAAAMAYLTVRQGDRVGAGLFAHELVKHLPASSAISQFTQICSDMIDIKPIHGIGDFSGSVRQAHARMSRAGLIVIFSDLLEDPAKLMDTMGMLRHDRFEVVVFHILAPQELSLEGMGGRRYRFVDAETRYTVGTNVSKVKQNYQKAMAGHVEAVRRGCLAHNVDYNLLMTDQPVLNALRRYLIRRQGQ